MNNFCEEVELLSNKISELDLKAYLIQYKRSIKNITNYYNSDNTCIKDRIINDNIFTELVFDKILKNINKNNYDKAKFLLQKEVQRIRIMLFYFDRGLFTEDIITQDVALDTLVEYQKQYLKKTGIKVDRKFNYNDLNLNDLDISKISCLVIHPSLVDFSLKKHK